MKISNIHRLKKKIQNFLKKSFKISVEDLKRDIFSSVKKYKLP